MGSVLEIFVGPSTPRASDQGNKKAIRGERSTDRGGTIHIASGTATGSITGQSLMIGVSVDPTEAAGISARAGEDRVLFRRSGCGAGTVISADIDSTVYGDVPLSEEVHRTVHLEFGDL